AATSIPGDATGIPGDATSISGDATSILGDATSIPGDATSIPGDATGIPGDATSIPGDATSILGDATSIPAFHSRFNRRVQVNHPNIRSFIKFLQGEENHFHHLSIQFHAGLGTRPKQIKTIAIQRRIDNLGERYYDGVINAMEYLDGLSFIVAKRKK
ncbi:unnamed protein product, partial [Rotaria sp. Silwood1]